MVFGSKGRLYIFLRQLLLPPKTPCHQHSEKNGHLHPKGDLHKWQNAPIFFVVPVNVLKFFYAEKWYIAGREKGNKHVHLPKIGLVVFLLLRFLKNFALNGVCCGPNGLLTARAAQSGE